MGTQESPQSFNHFEYATVVKASGIHVLLKEKIFQPLESDLSKLKSENKLLVKRKGIDFNFQPELMGILRYTAFDYKTELTEHVTVTDKFVEIDTTDKNGKVTGRLWNEPRAVRRVRAHIHKYLDVNNSPAQGILFDSRVLSDSGILVV
jgi:hypothetical protein